MLENGSEDGFEDRLKELRKIEQADARRFKACRRKMRKSLRIMADDRGRVTAYLRDLADCAGLDHRQTYFTLRDMERRGEIQNVIFPDNTRCGYIRLLPKPWRPLGEPVYNYSGRPAG
jgi:hypothetical protein